MAETWYDEIWTLHNSHFGDPWNEMVDNVNQMLPKRVKNRFSLHGDRLAPPWFNGDIEALEPGE